MPPDKAPAVARLRDRCAGSVRISMATCRWWR